MASTGWEVKTADHIGYGVWEDNTPIPFDNEDEALEYVNLITNHPQLRTSKRVVHILPRRL